MENPFIGAYWGPRQEDRRKCAERVFEFLRSLADDPLFVRWYPKSYSPKSAKPPLEITIESLEGMLKQQYTDIPKRPMLELGFSLSMWNGNNQASVGLQITCGAYSKVVGNAVVLNLPLQEPPRDGASLERFHPLVKKAIEAFDPDVAIATSSQFNARIGGGSAPQNGGWITYRRDRGTVFRTPLDKAI